MLKYLPVGLTQYVLNTFPNKSPQYHVTQEYVAASLQRLEVEKINSHQSVRGRSDIIAVLYKAHWMRLSDPSCVPKMGLQHSRTHIFYYWVVILDQ